jgi:predicted nucleic acid-binding protein
MVLVDTSVWIRFLAGREPFAGELDALIDREEVLSHDLVFGELLIGETTARGRKGRAALLMDYPGLARAPMVAHGEVVEFVRARRLQGRGIGWVDAHLLASAVVIGAQLWTADPRLAELASELKIEKAPDE